MYPPRRGSLGDWELAGPFYSPGGSLRSTMQCHECGRWLTSEDIRVVVETTRTYRCEACETRLPPEQARTELFAWV